MLSPLDIDRIQTSLRTPAGLLDLAAVVLCFGLAFAVDRRVRLGGGAESRLAKISAGNAVRLIFPLTALLLLLIVGGALRRWQEPAFFDIAVPLAVALALIRIFVYGMHGIFGPSHWLPLSERTISYTILAALLLYYVGILQEIGNTLSDIKLPIGKSEVTVLDLGRDPLALILAILASLWLSVP